LTAGQWETPVAGVTQPAADFCDNQTRRLHPRQPAAGALQFSMRITPIAKTFAAEIEDIEPLAKLSGRCSRVAIGGIVRGRTCPASS
jgi:hypothetical protein